MQVPIPDPFISNPVPASSLASAGRERLGAPAVPMRFSADWHPQLGASLAVFPRCVGAGEGRSYWPDLASFIEDPEHILLMYYPLEESDRSLCIQYEKRSGQWEALLFEEHEVRAREQAHGYEELMRALFAWRWLG